MTESGYPDFPTNPWTGIVAVPGTSQLIVRRLNETINVALASPEAKQRMLALSLVILGGSPETFAKKIETDMPVWEEIVRLSGAKAQ